MIDPRLSRRGLMATLCGASLAPAALAPAAFAAPAVSFPLRLAYARVGPNGFVPLRSKEQRAWSELQSRIGGLIETMEPIQLGGMLSPKAPETDGGASCALIARKLAADAGFSHVILYATHDGRKLYTHDDNWFSKAFASFRSEYLKYGRATGEAHLLEVSGGPAIASVTADAAPRDPLDPFDNHRNPEAETLAELTFGLERRVRSLARSSYDAALSIAD